MDEMNKMTPAPSSPSMNKHNKMMTMMHTSFYWDDKAELLFSNWPGSNTGMYVLSLLAVFVLAVLTEFLSRSRIINTRVDNGVVVGVLKTVLHGLRMCVAYLVMLAVMSYNIGIFIAVLLGHVVGFFVFGSRVFGSGNTDGYEHSDLGPMSC